MKQLFKSALLGVSLLIMVVPGAAARAASLPQPNCVPSGDGTQCLLVYHATYTDADGVTETADWEVDRYSGNIVYVNSGLSVSYIKLYQNGIIPSLGPISEAYEYNWYGSCHTIQLTLQNSGTYTPSYSASCL